ncbi:Hypothetical predicted protein [Mytilus galloprovincialis]|uniref:SGNH hydrolase-type esterase domain-containing protein n=1 Tax=Mytilus galloprovincialis TaxID=29158 RepID=A0A8B6G4V1_MYTGA|nr:Hypothetical predicted protein [Mytilus galloprovincialis]
MSTFTDLSQKEIVVVGHSFVRRLRGKFGTTPFHRSFALPSRTECVGTFGGRKMSTLHQVEQYARSLRQIYRQQRTSPFAVVLSIGGNDIDSRHFNESDYMRLLKRIIDTFNEAGVERVVVCNILPRKTPIKISSESYSQRRDLINNRLRLLARESIRRKTIYIYEFLSWITNKDLFCRDGIHFTHFGMSKYYFAIKAAILKTRGIGTNKRLGRAARR